MDQKDQPEQGFSANLFIGNLDPDVDEKVFRANAHFFFKTPC